MISAEIRKKFLDFFKEKGHIIIPSASLIPDNDPTVLFTTAGMHPLVPFLLGEKHPAGKRLANVQVCVRTGDIDEVGDENHHTFFEMLGNWSLGDYFKEDAIKFSFEFLTDKKWLGLEKNKLAVSFFEGDNDAPRDEETKKIWLSLGIAEERIKGLPKKDNWWGPAGQTGPCGPDTEMFYWSGSEPAPKEFDPSGDNSDVSGRSPDPSGRRGRWVEIWNDVFMQYFKNMDAAYEPLAQKNVDTGMGLERTIAVINGLGDDYKTDVFWPIIEKIQELSGKKYEDHKKEFRIIADHTKAAVFMLSAGIKPSNKERGYVLRKLIRRAVRYADLIKMKLGIGESKCVLGEIARVVIEIYKNNYLYLEKNKNIIMGEIYKEETQFRKTLENGLKEFEKGKDAFILYTTYGFPIELTLEIAKEKGIKVDIKKFEEELKKHQELSKTASAGMFKGGLADAGEKATHYHTATHLLLAALRQVLGEHVYQRGSNINAERLRFDFSHPDKMTDAQLKKVEEIINEKIKEDILVVCQTMSLEEAKKKNIMGIFENKYGDQVKTYTISEFSKEICGGPHANKTSELGHFKIIKEESSGAGVRRIKAILN